jgi:F-type H+-transporting ATPase subunit c
MSTESIASLAVIDIPLLTKLVSAAIVAFSLGPVGLAVGRIFVTLIESIARNPSSRDKVFILGILGFALTEAVALFALLVVFLILYSAAGPGQSEKVLSAALATLPLGFVGLAVGNIFTTLVQSVARNPSARDKVFVIGILGFALTEAVALFSLLVSFLILYS